MHDDDGSGLAYCVLILAAALLGALSLISSSSSVQAQATYYVGPGGSDDNAGQSPEKPLGSFEEAVAKLTPGDTLLLLDGIYEQDGPAGRLLLEDVHGTAEAPIVIQAQHERQAWLQGNGSAAPVQLDESSWIVVDGLRASSRDNPEGDDGSAVGGRRSAHIVLRRLLAHNPNRYENATVIGCSQCHHVLVEECEAYNFHRHGISFHRGDHITIRRSFVNARAAPTPEGSGLYEGHACCREAGDEGYSFYFTSNSILENSVSMHTEQLSIIGGVATVLGAPGGQNNRMLGNISYKDLRPGGFLQSRRFINSAQDRYGGFTDAADSIRYKDYLIVGGQTLDRGGDFTWQVARNATLDGGTFFNIKKSAPLSADASTRGAADDPEETRIFMGCAREEVGGCHYRLRNTLFLGDAYTEDGRLLYVAPPEQGMDFLLSYSNAWSDAAPDRGFGVREDIRDDAGRYQHAMVERPTKMGLGEGECLVFVPKGSNMKGAGEDGADIGANILYRYEDGELTEEPLWDPETGAFPHGAVIEGSPNDPGEHAVVAATIHEHLNVNTNGCQLPYSK